MIHSYKIESSDAFNEHMYPEVINELVGLRKQSADIHSPSKIDIVISYLKDHSIKTDLIESNRKISTLMTSGALRIEHLESLFTCCRHNARFLREFENCVRLKLNNEA